MWAKACLTTPASFLWQNRANDDFDELGQGMIYGSPFNNSASGYRPTRNMAPPRLLRTSLFDPIFTSDTAAAVLPGFLKDDINKNTLIEACFSPTKGERNP